MASASFSDSKKLFFLPLILGTFAAYSKVFELDFIYFDDDHYILENDRVNSGLSWENVLWSFRFSSFNWHPLTWISHMLDVEVFGLDPSGHHAINLLVHVVNVLLLFWVLSQMTGAPRRSFVVAALFGVHPLHVESVAWVSERKDVLCAFFWLVALTAYHRYSKGPSFLRGLTVVLSFALGLMSKPMIVTFPFLLLLLDIWPLKRLRGVNLSEIIRSKLLLKCVLEKVPLIIMTIVSVFITLSAQTDALNKMEFRYRFANALISYVEYLKNFFWPNNLSVYYPHPGAEVSFAEAVVCLAVLSAISILAVCSFLRRPYIAVGWFWYLGTLIPVIGFAQVGSQAMADRYVYMPLNGIFIMMVWGVADLIRDRNISTPRTGVVLAIIFFALIDGTKSQVSHWRNTYSLFKQAERSDPRNFLAHFELGKILMDRGQSEEGLNHLRKAANLAPRTDRFLLELGNALLATKKYEEGEMVYEKISQKYSLKWEARLNRALALTRLRRFTEAESEFKFALELNPGSAKIHNNLGLMKLEQNYLEEAETQFRKALKIDNGMEEAQNNLGVSLSAQKKYAEAARSYSKALSLNPSFGKAHFNLANILAAEGKFREAEEHYRRALKTEGTNPEIQHNMGAVLARQGRKKEAVQYFKKALHQDPNFEPSQRILLELGISWE